MKWLKVLLLLLVLPTGTLAQATEGQAQPNTRAQEEESINKVLSEFVDAWNKHDAKAFSMVFAEDADFTNVRGTSAQGRKAIEKFHSALFVARFKDTTQKITKSKIRFIKRDVAAVDAWWEMTGAMSSEGQELPTRKGLLNFVMTKNDNRWLILVMHNTELTQSQ